MADLAGRFPLPSIPSRFVQARRILRHLRSRLLPRVPNSPLRYSGGPLPVASEPEPTTLRDSYLPERLRRVWRPLQADTYQLPPASRGARGKAANIS